MIPSHRVAHAFNQAQEYHQQASIQRQVAEALAERLADLSLPTAPRILEIGCGTGFLSQHLRTRWPNAALLLSDIAPDMIRRCQETLGGQDALGPSVDFQVVDGQDLAGLGTFDLIVSSLAFQWFRDPLANLAQIDDHLRPGGHLAFATLGERTFQEWRALCARYQVPCGLHRYPDRTAWQSAWPPNGKGSMDERDLIDQHPSPRAFLKGLKRVGTALSPSDHQPISAADMRRIFRSEAESPSAFFATYHLLFGRYQKNNPPKNPLGYDHA